MQTELKPIIWKDETLFLLDQRHIPKEEVLVPIRTLDECHLAIKDMIVRGAPCIGFTAIFGLALWAKSTKSFDEKEFNQVAAYLKSARPTAVNLMYEVDRCMHLVKQKMAQGHSMMEVGEFLLQDAHEQIQNLTDKNTLMAQSALEDLKKRYGVRPYRFMTHCNTGILACGCIGTALGVVQYAHSKNLVEHVWVDETRPYLQGTRLTAFELTKMRAHYSIVVEGAASYILSHHKVDAIFVGADRIARNGDTANKVGTSTLAIVAKHYNVPFYVVAPLSSFDLSIASGKYIEIELRDEEEILSLKGHRLAPAGAKAVNPSFDVTDHDLITGIICERGLIESPNEENMRKVLGF